MKVTLLTASTRHNIWHFLIFFRYQRVKARTQAECKLIYVLAWKSLFGLWTFRPCRPSVLVPVGITRTRSHWRTSLSTRFAVIDLVCLQTAYRGVKVTAPSGSDGMTFHLNALLLTFHLRVLPSNGTSDPHLEGWSACQEDLCGPVLAEVAVEWPFLTTACIWR